MSGGLVGRVEQLLELAGKATKRPWKWWSPGYSDNGVEMWNLGNADGPQKLPVLDCAVYGDPDKADAELIVAAVNLVELLARDWQRVTEALNEVGPLMEEAMSRPLWGSLQGTWQTRARDWHVKHNTTLRAVAAVSGEPDEEVEGE